MDGKWMNTLIKSIVDHPKCKYMKNLQVKSAKMEEKCNILLDKDSDFISFIKSS